MSRALVPFERRSQEVGNDVDFAVSIKVRNGRLLGAVRRAGYRSLSAMCKAHGLSQWAVNDYATMTRSPFNRYGQPSPMAQMVADILKTQVDELFPARFLSQCLSRRARTEVSMTEDQIGMLIREPPRTPEDVLALDQAAARISDTLILLPPREERLLRLRFGMGLRDEKTLEETGEQFGVTRERIRQMEQRAIRKLSGPKRKHRLVEPAAVLGVGYFHVEVPVTRVTAAEAGVQKLSPAEQARVSRPPKPKPDDYALPLRRLSRRVKFPVEAAQVTTQPDFIRLLLIPAGTRSVEQKVALAYHLELEFQRRGAGPLRAQDDTRGAYLATLSHTDLQLMKYEWYMTNLQSLWSAFPPAPRAPRE